MRQWFSRYPVTGGLLLLNGLIFLAMNLAYPFRAASGEAVFAFGGLLGIYIQASPIQAYRLLTATFVHIGWQHLAMNSLSLYVVGTMAEQIWSKGLYISLYLLAGVFGGLLTMLLSPTVLSAGASSSIFGLFAAVAVLGYFGRGSLLGQLGQQFRNIIVVNLVLNLVMPDVNIWGHLGGALGGGLLALALPNRLPQGLIPRKWRLLGTGLVVSLATIAVALLFL